MNGNRDMNEIKSIDKARGLGELAISSVDTLTESEIDQSIPLTWNDQPPLISSTDRRGNVLPETVSLLKGMLRGGIPPALRCAVQLSNVIQAVYPHQSDAYAHDYRTLAKARALDAAYEHLIEKMNLKDSELIGANRDASEHKSEDESAISDLIPTISKSGEIALQRVLSAVQQILGVYAPLIRTVCAVLLTSMSESYAFCCVREMGHAVSHYFPVTRSELAAWGHAFGSIMSKLHTQTAEYLEDRGVMDDLSPIFSHFFCGLLPLQYVQRILDIYTLEGAKVLYRFGVALLVLFKRESAEQLLTISNSDEWWNCMKQWAHGNRFHFDLVVRKAYGVHGRGLRRQMRFPRRTILQRIIRMEEERIRADALLNEDGQYEEPKPQPLGLVRHEVVEFGEEEKKPVLAADADVRQHIAQWLPLTLRLTNLDLLFSTSYHGRTLERFYSHVVSTKHTVLLCEVLGERGGVVGMYASQVWRPSTQVYGDGACFLFRLKPNAECWKWQPRHIGDGGMLDNVDLENDDNNQTALLEQFMVGTRNYISMGGNPDGSCGLRLNEDLTVGESSRAVGFENAPLHGPGDAVFEVGLVEVYRLVRHMDGRPV